MKHRVSMYVTSIYHLSALRISGFSLTTNWLPTHWPAASTVESNLWRRPFIPPLARWPRGRWPTLQPCQNLSHLQFKCLQTQFIMYISYDDYVHMYLFRSALDIHYKVYPHMMYQLFLVINHWFTFANPFRLFPLGCPGHAPKRAAQSHEFLAFKTSSMLLFIQNWSWFDQLSNSICEKSITQTLCWVPFLFSLDGASQVQRGSPVFKGKQLSKTDSFGASWVPFSATTPFSSTTICSASCENRLGAGCEFKKYQYW